MRTSVPARNDRQFNSVEAIEQRLARIETTRRCLKKTLAAERLPIPRIGSAESKSPMKLRGQPQVPGWWRSEVRFLSTATTKVRHEF